MEIKPFVFSPFPRLFFGPEEIRRLPELASDYGKKILLLTGSSSLQKSGHLDQILSLLNSSDFSVDKIMVKTEPSPELIDSVTSNFRSPKIDCIVAIGGGSVIDAGKAVSAMLTQDCSVMEYLEGVGTGKKHNGEKVPFIAVPTTAGTGSETTKNAVLSRIGESGFKKSLRHDNFIPNIALIDPGLMSFCPPQITASSGMDAFAQLLESYMSTRASPLTDDLALGGIKHFKNSIKDAFSNGEKDIAARSNLAYAAMLSGVTLANAGLGTVHGFASAIGGYFDIPHGIICACLTPESVRMNIQQLIAEENSFYLQKYANVGKIFINKDVDIQTACNLLITELDELIKFLKIPRLGNFGIDKSSLDKIISVTSNKNNPVILNDEKLKELLLNCL